MVATDFEPQNKAKKETNSIASVANNYNESMPQKPFNKNIAQNEAKTTKQIIKEEAKEVLQKEQGKKRQGAKQKTINKVDEYAKSEEFKALSEDKQEAILSLKNLEPSIMPEGISTRDLAHLKEHFSDKFDKEQREKFLKLFNDTKQNPHIMLEMLKNGELRKEYIKAYQHKESKDLYYIAISKDERDITGIPTTQIQKVINDIARSERVIKEAENLEGISNTAAPFKNETSPQRSNESIAENGTKKHFLKDIQT